MTESSKALSLIVPAHNEAQALDPSNRALEQKPAAS